jgi:periplasmic protein TonB
MMAPRILVPVDAKWADTERAQERFEPRLARETPPFVRETKQPALAVRQEVFAEAMLENSPTRPPRRIADFVVSGTVQVLLVGVLLVVPLYFTDALALDTHQLNPTLLAPAPPSAPPPPAAPTRSVVPKRSALAVAGKLLAPTVIPHRIAQLSEEPDASDLAPAILPGDGVPGGVPGGQLGGVLGGSLSGAAPPAPTPIAAAPKGPVHVGGKVKAPRLIFGPDPVYPVLARQSRISGAVVIDAVIDAQGNVIEMRTVSGHPILARAAMEALRHWKYEPTILGGEAIPVELLVTLTFVSKGPQA